MLIIRDPVLDQPPQDGAPLSIHYPVASQAITFPFGQGLGLSSCQDRWGNRVLTPQWSGTRQGGGQLLLQAPDFPTGRKLAF